jgi:hypothetical protein
MYEMKFLGQQSSKPKKSPVKRPQSLPAEQKKDVPAATSSKVVDSHKQEEEETNLGKKKQIRGILQFFKQFSILKNSSKIEKFVKNFF